MWKPAENGKTIGQRGSENGTILEDEEYANSCRITLERDGTIAPFSITCGVYGLMVHTTFSNDEADIKTKYEGMKKELEAFIHSDENESKWCRKFTSKW